MKQTGQSEFIGALNRFAKDHGLEPGGDAETLIKKFIVVTSNGSDIDVAYPLIASDLEALKFRSMGSGALYRSTKAKGHTYSPDAWRFMFKSANVGQLADVKMGGADDAALEPYRHFKAEIRKERGAKDMKEWQVALAYATAKHVNRNAYAIARELLPVSHNQIANIAGMFHPGEFERGLGAMLLHTSFPVVNEVGFRVEMRRPVAPDVPEVVSDSIVSHGTRTAEDDAERWASSGIKRTEPVPWSLKASIDYMSNPEISRARAEINEFAPPKQAFAHFIGGQLTASNGNAVGATDWFEALTILDSLPVGAAMETREVKSFLTAVSNSVSKQEFSTWTDREAIKKLLTVHTKDWQKKWCSKWAINEPIRRAIISHLKAYPVVSVNLANAVKNSA